MPCTYKILKNHPPQTTLIILKIYCGLNGLVSMFVYFSFASACKCYVPSFSARVFPTVELKLNHKLIFLTLLWRMRVNTQHENEAIFHIFTSEDTDHMTWDYIINRTLHSGFNI